MGSTKYPLIAPPGGGAPTLPGTGQPGPMLPGEFNGGSVANLTKFRFDGVDPPSSLYLQRDDVLLLFASKIDVTTAETVNFVFRFLRAPEPQGGQPTDAMAGRTTGAVFDRGIIDFGFEALSMPVGLNVLTVARVLGEGYLLSIAATPTTALTRGKQFARASIVRGGMLTSSTAQLLFSDYVTAFQPAGWPGGRQQNSLEGPGWIHSVQVANPGAGADWAAPVLGNIRRRIISVAAELATSATVANRIPEMIVDDSVNISFVGTPNQVIPAGQTVDVSASSAIMTAVANIPDVMIPLPQPLILPINSRLRSETINIQVGDQWSAIWLMVEDWIDQT